MKFLICLLLALSAVCDASFKCSTPSDLANDYMDTACFSRQCVEQIEGHIQEEFKAAFSYMHLAGYFDQDDINRPGLAKFFYGAASEERSHAILMLDYLNMRGHPFDQDFKFAIDSSTDMTGISYKDALTHALNMEILVTKHIQKILNECHEDLHAQDKFIDPVMDEQHDGIRKIQGAVRRLDNMQQGLVTSAELAFTERLFDQMLLKGEIM